MTNGTSRNDEEQQEFYKRRFGARYLHVQWQPQVPNRKARRLVKRRKRVAE